GLFQTLDLGPASGRTTLRAQLPRPLRGGLVVRLSLLRAGELPLGTNAGLGAQPVSAGTLRLGDFRAGGRPVPTDFGSWTGGPGVAGAAEPAGGRPRREHAPRRACGTAGRPTRAWRCPGPRRRGPDGARTGAGGRPARAHLRPSRRARRAVRPRSARGRAAHP